MFDGNVPISHVVQVVRNDREKVGYVCRLKNPLGRHVAAELKRTALLEDMKPWFGSNAKSLGFFSILELLIFLFQVESNALLINYLDHCSTWL